MVMASSEKNMFEEKHKHWLATQPIMLKIRNAIKALLRRLPIFLPLKPQRLPKQHGSSASRSRWAAFSSVNKLSITLDTVKD